jgi:hypothetical protein
MDIDKLDIIVSVDTEGNNRLGNSLPTSIGIVVYDVKCMKFLTSFFVSLPPGEPDSNTLLWINDHKELFDASAKLVKPNVYVSDCAEHLQDFAFNFTENTKDRKVQIWTDNPGYDIGRINNFLGMNNILPLRYILNNTKERLLSDKNLKYGSEIAIDDAISNPIKLTHDDIQDVKYEVINSLFNASDEEIEFHERFWVPHNPLYDACHTLLTYLKTISNKNPNTRKGILIDLPDPRKWYQKLIPNKGRIEQWVEPSGIYEGLIGMALVNKNNQIISGINYHSVPDNIHLYEILDNKKVIDGKLVTIDI